MERSQDSISAERLSLQTEIQTLSQTLQAHSQSLDPRSLNEIKCLRVPHDIIVLVFLAAFEALGVSFESKEWRPILERVGSSAEFIQKLQQVGQAGEGINRERLLKIKQIYESQENLTRSAKRLSNFAAGLSEWVEIYVRLSEKRIRLEEIS